MNVAAPSVYFSTANVTHCDPVIWGDDDPSPYWDYDFDYVSPTPKAAIFWASLEEVSVAKRCLPSGDLLIPYISPFDCSSNTGTCCVPQGMTYTPTTMTESECDAIMGAVWHGVGRTGAYVDCDETPDLPPFEFPDCGDDEDGYTDHPWRPTEDDNRAFVKHLRMRGVDGVYMYTGYADTNEDDEGFTSEDRNTYREWVTEAWDDLDSEMSDFYGFLNFKTSKTLGVQWSGIVTRPSGQYDVHLIISNHGFDSDGSTCYMSDLVGEDVEDWFDWPLSAVSIDVAVPAFDPRDTDPGGSHAEYSFFDVGSGIVSLCVDPESGDTYWPDDDELIEDSSTINEGYGACTLPNMSCVETDEASCAAMSGTFQSLIQALRDDDLSSWRCDGVDDGACILSNGSCVQETPIDCFSMDGNFIGMGESCTSPPASPPFDCGVCCIDDTCSIDFEHLCVAAGGCFTGDSSCETTSCFAACCVGATCYDGRNLAWCNAHSGTFFPCEECAEVTCP